MVDVFFFCLCFYFSPFLVVVEVPGFQDMRTWSRESNEYSKACTVQYNNRRMRVQDECIVYAGGQVGEVGGGDVGDGGEK